MDVPKVPSKFLSQAFSKYQSNKAFYKKKQLKNISLIELSKVIVKICQRDFLKVAALKPRKMRELWEAAARGVL